MRQHAWVLFALAATGGCNAGELSTGVDPTGPVAGDSDAGSGHGDGVGGGDGDHEHTDDSAPTDPGMGDAPSGGDHGPTDEDAPCATMPEICDDLDNNCDNAIDTGCDDDQDGWCDAAMVVAVAHPASCPHSAAGVGDDCDDDNGTTHPGAPFEVCDDGSDNNCNGLTDHDDLDDCSAPLDNLVVTLIEATTARPNGSIVAQPIDDGGSVLLPGAVAGRPTAFTLTAAVAPYLLEEPSITWQVLSSSSCSSNDILHLDDQLEDYPGGITAPAGSPLLHSDFELQSAALVGCRYDLRITVGGAADALVSLEVVNRLPRVSIGSLGGSNPAVWNAATQRWAAVVQSWTTTAPSLLVTARETALSPPEDHTPYRFRVTDAAAALFPGCALGCEQDLGSAGLATLSRQMAATAPPPGIYTLHIEVGDAFDLTAVQDVDLDVEILRCVWVGPSGAGDDSNDGLTLAASKASVLAGLTAAAEIDGASVCLVGAGTFAEPPAAGPLVFPVGAAGSPNLLGGFTSAGNRNTSVRPTVSFVDPAGGTFAPGYVGTIRGVAFSQDSLEAARNTLTIVDASPTFADVTIETGGGAGTTRGVHVSGAAGTSPAFFEVSFRNGRGLVSDDAALLEIEGFGVAAGVFGSTLDSGYTPGGCRALCRLVYAHGGASVLIATSNLYASTSYNEGANPEPSAAVIGVDLDQAEDVILTDNTGIAVGTLFDPMPEVSVAVRLSQSTGVLIRDNVAIGSGGRSGTKFGAAIADGMIDRHGVVVPGQSVDVVIVNNDWIGPLYGDSDSTCEGSDVAAGIVLIGTRSSEVAANGRPRTSATSGISGGVTNAFWEPATRAVPPINAGVWLVETDGVNIEGNEVTAGTLRPGPGGMGCAATPPPANIGVLDGLPPAPERLPPLPPRDASSDLWVRRNGILNQWDPELGVVVTTAVGVELNAPVSASAPRLWNNFIGVTYGDVLVAVRQHGGGGAMLVNNTLIVDYLGPEGCPGPLCDTTPALRKWALLVEHLDTDGIGLINNIFDLGATSALPPPNSGAFDLERRAVREVTNDASQSRLTAWVHNLVHMQDAEASEARIELRDQNTVNTFGAGTLNNVPISGEGRGNRSARAAMSKPPWRWQLTQRRLTPTAEAIDAGDPAGADIDIDGQARPRGAAVDIGADEH